MSGSHVISGLIAKKAELSGLFKHYQLELGKIASDLLYQLSTAFEIAKASHPHPYMLKRSLTKF